MHTEKNHTDSDGSCDVDQFPSEKRGNISVQFVPVFNSFYNSCNENRNRKSSDRPVKTTELNESLQILTVSDQVQAKPVSLDCCADCVLASH